MKVFPVPHGVVEVAVDVVEAGSSTSTVRVAVPVFPAWSVAKKVRVLVEEIPVSRKREDGSVEVAPLREIV